MKTIIRTSAGVKVYDGGLGELDVNAREFLRAHGHGPVNLPEGARVSVLPHNCGTSRLGFHGYTVHASMPGRALPPLLPVWRTLMSDAEDSCPFGVKFVHEGEVQEILDGVAAEHPGYMENLPERLRPRVGILG